MSDTPVVEFESRMLIDGKLVDGESGAFANINPATEEVLGEVADASKADMHRAIDAAPPRLRRDRLVDESGPSAHSASGSCRTPSRLKRKLSARS